MEAPLDFAFGYCTNVHAGTSLDEAKANLLKYAVAVREQVSPAGRLPIGLWLADKAATSLIELGQVHEFGQWLSENHLIPYTMNGFPQGDFHQSVVKHAVYEPTWTCDSRARYTMCLAEIMEAILPTGQTGSISTLPLGWPHAPWHAENYKYAADNLLVVAKFLDRLNQKYHCEVVLAIEPEPGCVLNTAAELCEFFEHYLFSGPDAELARHYLTVCHDICHSGVMFEPQVEALRMYLEKGIRVGKVQVSSAVHVPWDKAIGNLAEQSSMLAQLKSFNEPKYLHQTSRAREDGRLGALSEDLPQALAHWLPAVQQETGAAALATGHATESFPHEPWRVHFHVPIYVDHFESLSTTQSDIVEACDFLEQNIGTKVDGVPWFTGHYEVETYAWPVLPDNLQVADLSSGIARELQTFASILSSVRQPAG